MGCRSTVVYGLPEDQALEETVGELEAHCLGLPNVWTERDFDHAFAVQTAHVIPFARRPLEEFELFQRLEVPDWELMLLDHLGQQAVTAVEASAAEDVGIDWKALRSEVLEQLDGVSQGAQCPVRVELACASFLYPDVAERQIDVARDLQARQEGGVSNVVHC